MQDSCTLRVSYKILATCYELCKKCEVSCTILASLARLLQERGHIQCTFSAQNVQELARYIFHKVQYAHVLCISDEMFGSVCQLHS